MLGTSEHCIATHPSDMAVAMRALDATIVTLKPDGDRRRIAIHDFYRLPGDTPQIETVLEPGELITHVELPAAGRGRAAAVPQGARPRVLCLRAGVGRRRGDGGRTAGSRSAALAFGGLAPMPWRDPAVEALLVGAGAVRRRVRTPPPTRCSPTRAGFGTQRLQDPAAAARADRVASRTDRRKMMLGFGKDEQMLTMDKPHPSTACSTRARRA